MDSKLIFLGTGGDSNIVGKQSRGSGGIIVRVDGYQFHIDPGPGSLVRTRQFNINPRNNTAVICTHNHLNHAGGLNEIISAMSHDGLDKRGVIIANNTVINGTELYDSFLNKRYKDCAERFITLKTGQKVGINSIEILQCLSFLSAVLSVGESSHSSEISSLSPLTATPMITPIITMTQKKPEKFQSLIHRGS